MIAPVIAPVILSVAIGALVAPRVASAEVDAALAIGGGQRGAQSYASIEARLDAEIGAERAERPQLRLGLAARGQWDNGRWRRDDFTTAAGWAAILRYLEWWWSGDGGELAVAAGALRPAATAHVSDGVQTAIDDRHHTGLRVGGRAGKLELGSELDDVFAPRLLTLEVGWRTGRWRAAAATAVGFAPWGNDASEEAVKGAIEGVIEGMIEGMIEGAAGGAIEGGMPPISLDPEAAIELSLARRFVAGSDDGGAADEARLGAGVVAEPGSGAHAVGFAELWAAAASWRVALRADVRLGTGSLGARFGPLYRLVRLERLRSEAPAGDPDAAPPELPEPDEPAMRPSPSGPGLAAGLSLRLERAGGGWLEGALRARRQGGAVATAHLGLPLASRAQAGAWLAADADHLALAGELRAFGRAGTFAAVEVSRLLRTRSASSLPELGWAVVGWVGVSR